MASGPWDNVQLQGPPNGPAWAQAAAQLMGATGNAVNGAFNAYNNQQQFGYQQRQQNFFQNPQNQQLLTNFIQQPTQQNYAALMQPMIQAGGMQAAGPMIDQLIGMQQDQNIAKLIGGDGGQPQPVNSGPASHSSAAGPGNITGNFGGAGSQPRFPYGVEGSNAPNVNTIVGKTGANIPDQVAQRFATSVGASSPEDDLTPDQAARVQQRLSAYLQRTGSAGGANPVPQSGGGDQEAAGSNELNPSTGQGSPAMTPRQGPERRTQTAAEAPANFKDRFGASGDRTGERTSPLGDKAKLDAMDARLAQLRAYEAAYARRSPAASQAAGKAADDLEKQRNALAESLSKYNEPGRTQRDVESGATLTAERIKNDTERYGKQYDAYQTRADNARQLVSTISANKAVMNSPGFYSGTGAEHVMALQNLGVALGLAPKDYAMANQVFGKTVAEGIMDQIKSLQGMGQIRVAEIKIMERAALNHDNSPSSNRMLAEMQDRLARNWTIPIAEAATGYNGGHLDAGFDKIKQKIMSKPLFTEDELRDPRRIAPIEVRSPDELKSYGWRDGEPFRDANTGRIFTHLPKGAAPPSPVNPANQT